MPIWAPTIKSDGSTAALGAVADVDLSDDAFYSRFTPPLLISAAAAALPAMRGSGQVRDLREAA